jgi:hypothetical protein
MDYECDAAVLVKRVVGRAQSRPSEALHADDREANED